jgi:type IV pilus assembly protein PilE
MRKIQGFTLIELMVVIAIIAIIAAIAVPAFTDQMRKSRRSDAARGLADLQLRQERWRASHSKYLGTDSTAADKTAFGAVPTSDYYDFVIESAESGTDFTLKATAKNAQQSDTACTPMKLSVASGVVTKSPTTGRCWN